MLGFKGLFGISVQETKDTVIVNGINGVDIGKFITNVWKTSVIEKYMFKKITGSRFGRMEFYKFFTIDVIYMLEKLAEVRNPRVPARTLHQIAELLKEKTWVKDTLREDIPGRLNFDRLSLFNYVPLKFQLDYLEYYNKTTDRYHLNGNLLNGAPGCGKTTITNFAHALAGCERMLVVCPKNAINRVWYDDIQKMYKKPPKVWNTLMSGEPDPDTQIFVYHYEAIERAFRHHENDFKRFKYGLTLDESHNLNDVKSQRTQRWIELCKLSGSKNIIHASGTPLKAMGIEAIPLFRVLDSAFTPPVEEAYRKIYGTSAQKGLDILKNRLGIVSFVITKDQLELSKPEMLMVDVKIPNGEFYTLESVRNEMTKFIAERLKYYKDREVEDLAFYKKCLAIHEEKIKGNRKLMQEFDYYKKCIREIQNTTDMSHVKDQISFCKRYEFSVISNNLPREVVKDFRSVCSIVKYLTLKIQGECLGQVVGKMRIAAHVEMSKHIPYRDITQSTKKKTVVFTSFVDVLETARTACQEKHELDPILVYGKTNSNLNNLIKEFEVNEMKNPLIATYDSLSTAVPLVMADTMIMINAPFRAYIQEQAIARIHRLRQDSQTRVYQCKLDTGNKPNISSRSLDIMSWSQQQVEQMTGVKSPYQIEEGGDSMTVSAESYLEDDSLGLTITLNPDKTITVTQSKSVPTLKRAFSDW